MIRAAMLERKSKADSARDQRASASARAGILPCSARSRAVMGRCVLTRTGSLAGERYPTLMAHGFQMLSSRCLLPWWWETSILPATAGRNAMLKEYHSGKVFWPNNNRVAVTLTFDFQGGEDVRPLPNGLMDHEEYTQCEYGPHTGVWRILRILEQEGVKATFLTCGGIAE